ncbi:MAG: type II secretion system F family protein [Dethiobacteria bacterium]
MPKYIYQARNRQGMEEKGVMTANRAWEVAALLREQGLFPFSIKELTVMQAPKSLKFPSYFCRPKVRELMAFCHQFAAMNKSGITALRSLKLLAEQVKNPILKDKIGKIAFMVEEGNSLVDSFQAHSDIFPPLFVNMIAVGESSGTLDEVLERLAEYYEKQNELQQKVKKAMAYPLFMLMVIIVVCLLLITVVLPVFIDFFDRMGLNTSLFTGFLLTTGEMVLTYWYVFPLGLIIGLYLGKKILRTGKGAICYYKFLLFMPFLGPINRAVITARFCRTLGMLLNNGIVLLEALAIAENIVGNKIASEEVRVVIKGIMEGQPMAGLLANSNVFPPMVVGMVNAGEQSGRLDDMLFKAAAFYEAEVGHLIEGFSSILEPILIVILSMVVGFIALTILLPVYDAFQLML